ncbi:hypothetical protein KP003_14205 [Geomonas nitrogeniifigens]|uniref:hypothetical protein n=1 Tax=Geomonas diazotrophica TaxID=2843197 RepID=UPI001C2B7F72|nr:hypothetical protein [Geomonas nitrogeniifigens]QXE85529.1 hypothetical protein KP003_14205 [Geomonas nitrogeniifigens]
MNGIDPVKVFTQWGAALKSEWHLKTAEEESNLRVRLGSVEALIESMQDLDSWEIKVEELAAALAVWKEQYDELSGRVRGLDSSLRELQMELARAEQEDTHGTLDRCENLLSEMKRRFQFQEDLGTIAAVSAFFDRDFGSLTPFQFEKEAVPGLRQRVARIKREKEADLERVCAKARDHGATLGKNEELRQMRDALSAEIAEHSQHLSDMHRVSPEVMKSLKDLQPHQKEDLLNAVLGPKARDAALEKKWEVPANVIETERQKWK